MSALNKQIGKAAAEIGTAMKQIIFYHATCADGFAAAFAAWLKLGDSAKYVPVQYGDVENVYDFITLLTNNNTSFCDATEIFILDFSFPKEVMHWLFRQTKRVVWLDHHKTAFEMWCEKYKKGMRHETPLINVSNLQSDDAHYIALDDNKSGAYLAWEFFHPGTEAPMFIRHIDDYDRWQFKIEETKEFYKALWSYTPWSFEQWQGWMRDFTPMYGGSTAALNAFKTEGAAILRAHEQNVQALVNGAAMKCAIQLPITPKEYTDEYLKNGTIDPPHVDGLAANCPPNLVSDVGHELANQSGTFGLLWSIDKNGRCNCSLRSDGDYDVSAIAKAFGGGGHKNAAGFIVEMKQLLSWISVQ